MSNWLKKRWMQAITGLYYDRCDPNDFVWAQLANAYFLQALFSYGTPGWKDVIDMGTGHSWLKHARRNMRAAKPAVPKWITPGGDLLAGGAEFIDRTAWLMMVITTFGGAALQWGSAAYKTSPCEAAPDYAWWNSNDPLGFWDNQNDWAEGPIWIVKEGNQGSIRSSETVIPAGHQGYLYVACNFEKFVGLGGLYGWSTRIRERAGPVVSEHHYTYPKGGHLHGPLDFHFVPATFRDRSLVWEWKPEIRGGFTETYVVSGTAGAGHYIPGGHRKGLTISFAPRAYNFASVLDPEFQ